MNKEMEKRWTEKEAPFDGVTLTLSEDLQPGETLIPLPSLHKALAELVDSLHRLQPEAKLMMLMDWHENDGYVCEGNPSNWQHLHELTNSAEALYNARSHEHEVRIAFFPQDCSFVLRFYIPEMNDLTAFQRDNYSGRWGHFDVTCSEEMADELEMAIQRTGLSLPIRREDAHDYFACHYGG